MGAARKREIGHWNAGKSCKGNRKAKERTYTAREIDEQIAATHPDFRYRTKKRNPNKIAQLEYSIQWYKEILSRYETTGHRSVGGWCAAGLKIAEKKLAALKAKEPK